MKADLYYSQLIITLEMIKLKIEREHSQFLCSFSKTTYTI